MPPSPEEAVGQFLLEVLGDISALLQSADRVTAWLGPTDDDTELEQFLAAHADDVADLATLAGDLLDGGGTSAPAALDGVAAAWHALQDLLDAGPTLRLGGGDAAVNILARLAGVVLDRQLQLRAPVVWALARILGITGDGAVPHQAIAGLLSDPADQIWATFVDRPTWQHLGLHWFGNGGRSTSLIGGRLPDAVSPSPDDVVAVDPSADALVRLVALTLDHVPSGMSITVEAAVVVNAATDEFRGVTVRISPPLVPDIALTERLHLQFEGGLADGFGAFVAVDGTITALLPTGSLLPTVRVVTVDEADPDTLVGNRPIIDASIGPDHWSLTLGVADLDVAIEADESSGAVVRAILPENGIRLTGSVSATASPGGLLLEGGIAPNDEDPPNARFSLQDLSINLTREDGGIVATAQATAVAALGPAALVIEGVGVRITLTGANDGRGSAGLFDVTREFVQPAGVGFDLDTALIRGGGFLARDEVTGEMHGAVDLDVRLGATHVAIVGFASIGTVADLDGNNRASVIALMAAQFLPPIPLAFGLSVTGIGGFLGINRGIDLEVLRSGLADGSVGKLLFPTDVAQSAPEIFPLLRSTFPPLTEQHVLGPMLQLGWGLPVPVARASVAVLVPLPNTQQVTLLGRVTVDLPSPEQALIHLDAQFLGSIDLDSGAVSIDASLVESFLGPYQLSGDLALRTGPAGFVLAIGGVHPRFTPPRPLPELRRVTLDLSRGEDFQFSLEAYLAVAAGSIQFGALASLQAVLGSLAIEGQLGFDALVRTRPTFTFEVDVLGHLLVRRNGDPLCTADVALHLEGPGRWHALGTVSVRVLGLTLEGDFDRSWGTAAIEAPSESVNVAAQVSSALAAPAAWAVNPPIGPTPVRITPAASGGLHPHGRLLITQTVAPLDVRLERFGPSSVSGPTTINLTSDVRGAEQLSVTPTTEPFIRGDFFELTDDQRLTTAPIADHEAGLAITGGGWQIGPSLSHSGVGADATVAAWVRRGIVPNSDSGELQVSIDVAGAPMSPGPRQVVVLGPGAASAIEPSAVSRMTPANGSTDAPFDELAVVEFRQPDLPWMLSPATDQGPPHPWVMAVVVPVSAGVEPLGISPTGLRRLRTSGHLLPDPANAGLWAHAHVDHESIGAAALERPSGARSRLICPTPLEPGTDYLLCVVPVFAAGRDTGLGRPTDVSAAAGQMFAWAPADDDVDLPVYASARFTTAAVPAPSFAELLGRLSPHVVAESYGVRSINAEGVVVSVGSLLCSPAAEPLASDSRGRAAILAALDRVREEGRPAPRYGSSLTTGDPDWLDELNHDPASRVVAGLGAALVRSDQDELIRELTRALGARPDEARTNRRQYVALAEVATAPRWLRPPTRQDNRRGASRIATLRVAPALDRRKGIVLDRPRRPVPRPAEPPTVTLSGDAFGRLIAHDPQWAFPDVRDRLSQGGSGPTGLGQDSVTVLAVNREFVAALMVGMNEAIHDEARWRQLPLPPLAAPIKHFWPGAGAEPDLLKIPDADPASVGDLVARDSAPAVVAVRGEVVRRFGSLTIDVNGSPAVFQASAAADTLLAGFPTIRLTDVVTFTEAVRAPRFKDVSDAGRAPNSASYAIDRWQPAASHSIPAAQLLTEDATLAGGHS